MADPRRTQPTRAARRIEATHHRLCQADLALELGPGGERCHRPGTPRDRPGHGGPGDHPHRALARPTTAASAHTDLASSSGRPTWDITATVLTTPRDRPGQGGTRRPPAPDRALDRPTTAASAHTDLASSSGRPTWDITATVLTTPRDRPGQGGTRRPPAPDRALDRPTHCRLRPPPTWPRAPPRPSWPRAPPRPSWPRAPPTHVGHHCDRPDNSARSARAKADPATTRTGPRSRSTDPLPPPPTPTWPRAPPRPSWPRAPPTHAGHHCDRSDTPRDRPGQGGLRRPPGPCSRSTDPCRLRPDRTGSSSAGPRGTSLATVPTSARSARPRRTPATAGSRAGSNRPPRLPKPTWGSRSCRSPPALGPARPSAERQPRPLGRPVAAIGPTADAGPARYGHSRSSSRAGAGVAGGVALRSGGSLARLRACPHSRRRWRRS